MNTTKILGEAVGIQRQDIIDRTEEQTADGLTGAVILGRFKRGRVDVPMEIHQGNIRGQLGYDPKNPDYIAVQDCLDTDVPSVQVLRVKGGDESGNNSSYDLFISPDLQYSVSGVNEIVDGNVILWNIEVDNVLYPQKLGWVGYEPETYVFLEDYLGANQSELGIMAKYEEDEITEKSSLRIYSITNKRKFVRLIPNVHYISRMNLTGNPTASIDKEGVISFWLEPNNEVQIPDPDPDPDPEPEVCNCELSWVRIPDLTPSVKIGAYDEFVLGIENHVQNTEMSYSADTPVINLLKNTLAYSDFVNRLELIRCDSEGTLLRNKTDACLTVSMMTLVKNSSGIKEPTRYLTSKDLCAYDASEVIPDTNTPIEPENWDIKYKVNGQWIYETTGPIVTLSTERNSAYKNLATELVFSDSVESIGSSAFQYWSNLAKVTCGNSLKTIGYYAFQECSGLKIIDFGESLTLLSNYSLTNLYAIETIIFRGLTPPERENNTFGNGGSGSTLPKAIYVPDSLVQAYNEKIWDFHIEIFHPLSTYTS